MLRSIGEPIFERCHALEMLCIQGSYQRPIAPSQERLSAPSCRLHIIWLLKPHEPVQAIETRIKAGNVLKAKLTTREGNQGVMLIQGAVLLTDQGHGLWV